MKLRQLWEENTKKGACVDKEMRGIIFCVETGENIPAEKNSVNLALTSH